VQGKGAIHHNQITCKVRKETQHRSRPQSKGLVTGRWYPDKKNVGRLAAAGGNGGSIANNSKECQRGENGGKKKTKLENKQIKNVQ